MPANGVAPWPEPTAPPDFSNQDSRSFKRRRLVPRQVITDQAQVEDAQHRCQFNSGNEVISCFPSAGTVIPQGEWATFVWNSRRPEITQFNQVNIYLFRADSRQQIMEFRDRANPSDQAGIISAQVDDRWFGTDGLTWTEGRNQSFPYYWVIIRSDKTLDGNEIPQSTFTAVQTTVLGSVARSSASAAAASSSSAAALSASIASLSSVRSAASASASAAGGNVQSSSSDSGFPRWAIAVIVILGFLAITATCLLTFLICRRIRRQQRSAETSRNSMGSNSPMINREAEMTQRYDSPGSPLLPPPSAAALAGGAAGGAAWHGGSLHDGASTDSGGPFSSSDAAIMAQAFRTTLKQPTFIDRPVEEGESPEQPEGDDNGHQPEGIGNSTLNRELAAEGRDIRSVSSSRGVKVETSPGPDEGR